jgi:hypothetical protein
VTFHLSSYLEYAAMEGADCCSGSSYGTFLGVASIETDDANFEGLEAPT